MDIKDFANYMNSMRGKFDSIMRREMPGIVGRMAKDHFQDNFRKGGFVNGGLHPWPTTRRQSSGGSGAAAKYGPLLSRRNHLFRSINYTPADYRVRVSNELRYAPIHNWGGIVNPTVTDRMRRFAWYMFYKSSGMSKKAATGQKKRKKVGSAKGQENPQAQFWKRLALTKKTKLQVRTPQRQFLGESSELTSGIAERVENEIRKILNS